MGVATMALHGHGQMRCLSSSQLRLKGGRESTLPATTSTQKLQVWALYRSTARLVIQANLMPDPCASWLQINRRPYTSDPLSPTSLKRMKELIRQAEEKCPVKIVKEPFLPTRLLDVQADCPSGLRLVITKTDPEVCKLEASQRRYAALSYCWGSGDAAAKQLKTVRDTLEEHCTSIAMEKVPQTVAETVQVCRAIGIRFLWVDALCIIQRDEEDWAKESFQMSLVYENSYFTLCAIQGDSCSSSFLQKDYDPPSVRLKFQSSSSSSSGSKKATGAQQGMLHMLKLLNLLLINSARFFCRQWQRAVPQV